MARLLLVVLSALLANSSAHALTITLNPGSTTSSVVVSVRDGTFTSNTLSPATLPFVNTDLLTQGSSSSDTDYDFTNASFEITMQPTAAERAQLLAVFAAMAVVAAVAAWWLPRWARRLSSLRSAFVVLSVSAVVLVGAVAGVAARLMFLSRHDLDLLLSQPQRRALP